MGLLLGKYQVVLNTWFYTATMSKEYLTPRSQITYSVRRSMEETGEVNHGVSGKVESQPKAPKAQPTPEQVEKARLMWETQNKGKEISVEERQMQRILIEMGRPPIGGGADLTDEAKELVERFNQGSVPPSVNENIARILRENGISEEDIRSKTSNQLMGMLRDMGSYDANIVRPEDVVEGEEQNVPLAGNGGIQEPPESPVEGELRDFDDENENGEEIARLNRIIDAWGNQGVSPVEARNRIMNGELPEGYVDRPNTELERELQRLKSADAMLKHLGNKVIRGSDSVGMFRGGATRLLESYVNSFKDEDFKEGQTFRQRFDEILDNPSLDIAKEQLSELVKVLSKKFTTVPEGQRDRLPESFDEFVDLIIEKESDEYGPGGMFELKDNDGNIRYENLSRWAWAKMLWWDAFSPDDPKLNFFQVVSINLNYRTITLNDFLTDNRYKKGTVLKDLLDKNGKIIGKDIKTYEDNEEYGKMVDKLVDEIWFFSQDRNFGVNYRLSMGTDKALLESAMGPILNSDTFTRGNGFQTLYSFSGISGDGYLDEENGIAGEMAAVATDVYHNIASLEEMQKLLGNDTTFFRKNFLKSSNSKLSLSGAGMINGRLVEDGDKESGNIEDGTSKGRGKTSVRGVTGAITFDENWYGEDGVLKTRRDKNKNLDWRRGRFLDYVNIFNEKIKEPQIVEEVRERLRQSLVEKMLRLSPELLEKDSYLYQKYGKIFGVDLERSIGEADNEKIRQAIVQAVYQDATRAEAVAFYSTRWLQIAAMNDTTATGFDVGTKWSQTLNYRRGQGRPGTVGTDLGNIRTLGIYKRVLLPVSEAIKTRTGVPLQRAVSDIAKNAFMREKVKDENGNEVVDEKTGKVKEKSLAKEEAKKLKFRTKAMSTMLEDFVVRGAPVYDQLADGESIIAGVSEIVKWDPWKGFITDAAKFTKDLKGKFKQRRYAFSSYGEVNYGEKIEVYEQREVSKLEQELIRKEMIEEEAQRIAEESGISIESVDRSTINVEVPSFRVLGMRESTVGEEMFGKQVFKRNFMKPGTDVVDWDKVGILKNEIWKEALLLEIAAELVAARDKMDMSKPVSFMQIQGFFEILKKIPSDIKVDEENLLNTTAEYEKAFTDDMLRYLRKVSKTETWRLLAIYGSTKSGKGVIAGLMDMWKSLQGAFK